MTDFNRFQGRNRDQQDGYERGVWGEIAYLDTGAIMKVRGTGDTEDVEAPVMNYGYGFNVPKNYNTEVFLVSHGSDTNQKYAVLTLPRDKQRKWDENTGGVQNPIDPDKALVFTPKRTYITDPNFSVLNGSLEVEGNTVRIRGNLEISGDLNVGGSINVGGVVNADGAPKVTPPPLPDFSE